VTSTTVFESPLGPFGLSAQDEHLRRLRFDQRPAGSGPRSEPLRAAVSQLDEYFAGERRGFELPLDLRGTEFQRQVWSLLRKIPYGATTTYGALARELWSDPDQARLHARAVGAAVGSTPVPIFVPCHRVVGADGSLTGYGGGLARKRALLDFEASGGDVAVLQSSWSRRQLALL
jgi:methylated-DNA-[protein]-cysteine S-methyltransferase